MFATMIKDIVLRLYHRLASLTTNADGHVER